MREVMDLAMGHVLVLSVLFQKRLGFKMKANLLIEDESQLQRGLLI